MLNEMEMEATDDVSRFSGSGGTESYFGTPLVQLVTARAWWLISLLMLQSLSSIILTHFSALIERHLDLPAGCLEPVLPDETPEQQGPRREPLLRRFTPGSIDVFTTWQGTLLYGLLTLGLIYGVNLQQQQLAARGLLALRPIPPLPPQEQTKPARPEQTLLSLYPDLQPLELAAKGQGVAQLRRSRATPPAATGLLELQLSQPSQLNLESASGVRTSLRNASGSLSLPLSGGFSLGITPPPGPADRISWNGEPLAAVKGQPGRYARP